MDQPTTSREGQGGVRKMALRMRRGGEVDIYVHEGY
jgi:hypothetical protein